MSARLDPKHGDVVHVKGVVRVSEQNGNRPVVDFTVDYCLKLDHCEVVAIERPNFQVGDRVIAGSIRGEIVGIFETQLWVRPDSGNRIPSTFDAVACDREPAAAPSAEIIDGPGRLVPRTAEAAE